MLARTLSAVLLIASALYAQNEARFSISARIVDDLDHKGAAGVRVTLTGSTLTGAPPVAFTNDGGGFNFSSLAAGKYRLIVDHPGFLPQGYPEVTVGDTSTLQLGDLVLVKKRPMSGTVKWKDGEPVAGAFVTVMGFRGGHYSRAPNGGTQVTNDKGEFIFPGGNPRHYIFFAYVANQGNSDLAPRIAAPVFFPAVSTPEQATILSMRTTPEFNQIHIVLDDAPGGDIEGTVTSGYYPAGTQVQLGLVVPNVSIGAYLTSVTTKVGDSFVMPSVPPGNYLLMVNVRRAPTGPGQPDVSLDLYPVTIRPGESARGLKIVVSDPALITGKVEIEEADAAPAAANTSGAVPPPKLSPPPQFAFQFEVGDLQSYGLVPAVVDRDGNFRGTGAARGLPYKLSPGMNLPCQCYLARMTQGDKDLLAGAQPVVGGGDPFRMVLRKDGGSAEGKVSENNKIPNKAFVVLAPRKREVEYWYRKAFTLPDGSFKLTNIAPGDYDLFAFDRDEDTQYLDPNFLAKYVGSAVHVTVQASTGGSYDLKMVRIP